MTANVIFYGESEQTPMLDAIIFFSVESYKL